MTEQTDILKHLLVSASTLQQKFGLIPTLLFIKSVYFVPVLRPSFTWKCISQGHYFILVLKTIMQ